MEVTKAISPSFADVVFDWDYETYLIIGGYGSGKSYNGGAMKVILKCLEEKRKVLVMREVYDTHRDSTFDLLDEIMSEMEILTDDYQLFKRSNRYVYKRQSPMGYMFPNGSRIIFKGMDKAEKLKSLNGVSMVWLEECNEIKYEGYKELLGRLRTKNVKQHFILTCNPVETNNWVYKHFFKSTDEEGKETVILDEERLYAAKEVVKNGVYYHHSTADDNPFLPKSYIKRLDEMARYDKDLYRIARLGKFGSTGTKVLPQFEIATDAKKFVSEITKLGARNKHIGMDFGFETSYNAVISMAVDLKKSILYIYDEVYKNKVTDDKFAQDKKMLAIKARQQQAKKDGDYYPTIIADNEDPKAIQYYRQCGYEIRGCKNKFAGSRLSNTRKVKRFKRIICSPKCINTIKELKDLTYKVDRKGNVIYDDFNIDPHTFSAIWYGLEQVTVADVKDLHRNSRRGGK